MLWRKLAVVPLFVIGFFMVFHLSRSLWDIYHRTDRVAELKNEIQRLGEEKARLEEEKAFRQTAEFVEQEARNKLQMTKEGEHILVLPEGQNKEIRNSKLEIRNDGEKPNWQKWVEFWLEM